MPTFSLPQLRQNQIAIIVAVLGGLLLLVVAYFLFRKPSVDIGPVTSLTVWGTEPRGAMDDLLAGFTAVRPNIQATYVAIDPAVYDRTLVEALAAGEGPDVFVVPSTDIGSMRSKLTPGPSSLTDAYLQSVFPKAIPGDVIDSGFTWALPLSLDTLVLLYNRDLLDAAGMVAPPATWDEVVASIPRLAAVDDQNQIQRAAIALGGTSESISHAADIVSLLAIQNGAAMSNQAHTTVSLGTPGAQALRFYTQFANPAATTYTWNDRMGDSFQQFADGKLAMLISYPSALDTLRERNPFLDVRVAPVPQATGGTPRSFGTYPTLAVSKQSPFASAAWEFVLGVTTNAPLMTTYAADTGRAAALTSVIGEQIKDPATTVAATQALQARTWFQWDGDAVRTEMDKAIGDITSGISEVQRATNFLEQRLAALIRQ